MYQGSNINLNRWKVLGVVWMIMLFGCVGNSEKEFTPEWKTITHEQYNFTLDYPSKWVSNLYGESGFKGMHDVRLIIRRPIAMQRDPSTFEILVESRPMDNPDLQDVVDWSDEYLDKIRSDSITKLDFEDIFLEKVYSSTVA